MKRIEAIIRPEKLDGLRQALEAAGCSGIMISEIEGHGKQQGITQQWRGERYRVDLLPKLKIEVVVKDGDAQRLAAVIAASSRTGEMGDGKIFISPVYDAIRIRTGERGDDAL